jgi:hypothetical protein
MAASRATNYGNGPTVRRRRLLTGIAVAGLWSLLMGTAGAQEAAESPFEVAIRVLRHEKSAAEEYGYVLATIGKADTAKYVRGILLYANAKADFDGLIEELKFDLINGQDPATSSKFARMLGAAAAKRIAFTDYVTKDVVGGITGARPGLPDVLTVVPDLVKAITEAGLSIWEAYHDATKERRDAIIDELGHMEWRSFADLAKT